MVEEDLKARRLKRAADETVAKVGLRPCAMQAAY
jgi:hypothetical protein